MIKLAHSVKQLLHSDCFITKIFHVNLALHLINEVNPRCQNTYLSDSLNAFDFLQNSVLRKFLIKQRHSIFLDESFFANTLLAKQLSQINASFRTLFY